MSVPISPYRLLTHFIAYLFYYSHSSSYKVVSDGFDLHLSNDSDHFSHPYWPFVYILWITVYSNVLPIFNWDIC